MPKRKKHPRLPNGYGSIRYLGKGRNNPYAVHPPGDLDGNRPSPLCYVDDWMKGFIVLTAYKAGTYKPGMERGLDTKQENGLSALAGRIIADYSKITGSETGQPERTFKEVYQAFYDNKFYEGNTLSKATASSCQAAFSNCSALHQKAFRSLRVDDLQAVLDNCQLKRSSLELIKSLFRQMYHYAEGCGWCDKDYSTYLKIKQAEDDEHGVPFSDAELSILWKYSQDKTVEVLLILCLSGWRISEFKNLEINLESQYFRGGLKTEAGKNRIVPIHPAILPIVQRRQLLYGCMLPQSISVFRREMEAVLRSLNLLGTPKHTPHDCRHTFSRLCEKYNVRENDRKRLMGHAFQDITNKVYGHRELEDLREEIEKIKVDL